MAVGSRVKKEDRNSGWSNSKYEPDLCNSSFDKISLVTQNELIQNSMIYR